MAALPASDRWDLNNWTAGGSSGVTLFEALGIKKGTIAFPKLQTLLTSAAATSTPAPGSGSNSSAGSGNTPGAATGNLGGTGSANGCTAAQNAANQKLGRQLAATYGWGTGQEWNDLNQVVMLESGWCNTAQNPTSTAYGIGQFLNTTWAGTGYSKTSDPSTQIKAMLKYIKSRYGTPAQALSFHLANGWY